MIEAHHALEISPKSLFGRHPYPHEQTLIRNFTNEIDKSVIFVSPMTVAVPVPMEHLPADFRRRKIKEHLERARDTLVELGV